METLNLHEIIFLPVIFKGSTHKRGVNKHMHGNFFFTFFYQHQVFWINVGEKLRIPLCMATKTSELPWHPITMHPLSSYFFLPCQGMDVLHPKREANDQEKHNNFPEEGVKPLLLFCFKKDILEARVSQQLQETSKTK